MKIIINLYLLITIGIFISCSSSENKTTEPNSGTGELGPTSEKNVKEKPEKHSYQDSITERNLKRYEEAYKLQNYIISSLPDSNFTIIKNNCGIFISPDTVQIEEMKEEFGEDNYYTSADDEAYYSFTAKEFLEKKQIKCIFRRKGI